MELKVSLSPFLDSLEISDEQMTLEILDPLLEDETVDLLDLNLTFALESIRNAHELLVRFVG